MKHLIVALFGLLMAAGQAHGAIPPQHSVAPKKQGKYVKEGLFTGGQLGSPVTLLNMRRQYSRQLKMERLVVDLGDSLGKPLKSGIGYVHVAVQKNPSRVVIDFSQMQRSALDQRELKKIFSRSPNVKKVDLRYDPQDVATSVVLYLKKPLSVEAFEMSPKGKKSRLVIDMKEPKRKKRVQKKKTS